MFESKRLDEVSWHQEYRTSHELHNNMTGKLS
jgi:hypothetical protein